MNRSSLLAGFAVPALLLTGCATTEVEPAETPAVAAAPAEVPAPAAAPAPAETPAVAGMTSAPPAPIAAIHPQFLAAWQGTDADAVAAFYADDAVVTVPDGTVFTGKEEIRSRWIGTSLGTMSDFDAVPESFEMAGDRITEVGRYSFQQTVEGETEMVAGRYQGVWERQPDGSWLIISTQVMAES